MIAFTGTGGKYTVTADSERHDKWLSKRASKVEGSYQLVGRIALTKLACAAHRARIKVLVNGLTFPQL
jgi:hypothetical protein